MAEQQLFFIDLKTGAGIDGESTKIPHQKWMEASSWSFSMHQSADHSVGQSAGTGTAALGSFSFDRVVDKASPKLLDRTSRGAHIPTITFEAERQGTSAAGDGAPGTTPSTVYMQLIFSDVVISNRSVSWASADRGTESISLTFGAVKMTHTQVNTDGSIGTRTTKMYDAKQNKAQ